LCRSTCQKQSADDAHAHPYLYLPTQMIHPLPPVLPAVFLFLPVMLTFTILCTISCT
jgi:hypothetical protein